MTEVGDQAIEISNVQLQDMPALMQLAVEFFYESDNRDMTLDTAKYRRYLDSIREAPFTRIFMVRCAGFPAAYAVISAVTEFTKEPIGELYHFYVRPDYRGTHVGRALVARIVDQFDQWNTYKDFAEAASGVDSGRSAKMFENLFKKFGYRTTGVVMVRERKNGS